MPFWGQGSYCYHVKEAGSAPLLVKTRLSEEELLGMASNLSRGSGGNIVPGDPSPVSSAKPPKSYEESPVLFFCPWNSYNISYMPTKKIQHDLRRSRKLKIMSPKLPSDYAGGAVARVLCIVQKLLYHKQLTTTRILQEESRRGAWTIPEEFCFLILS